MFNQDIQMRDGGPATKYRPTLGPEQRCLYKVPFSDDITVRPKCKHQASPAYLPGLFEKYSEILCKPGNSLWRYILRQATNEKLELWWQRKSLSLGTNEADIDWQLAMWNDDYAIWTRNGEVFGSDDWLLDISIREPVPRSSIRTLMGFQSHVIIHLIRRTYVFVIPGSVD
jgi:hypothetical protein